MSTLWCATAELQYVNQTRIADHPRKQHELWVERRCPVAYRYAASVPSLSTPQSEWLLAAQTENEVHDTQLPEESELWAVDGRKGRAGCG